MAGHLLREVGLRGVINSQTNSFCYHTDLEPIDCKCGEEETEFAWVWSAREDGGQAGSVLLGAGQRQITFNPEYSSGTAAVRGREVLTPGLHHYWELKMTSAVYGTDIMVGVCTPKCDLSNGIHRFCSLLGQDSESWGYSYTGLLHHGGKFCRYGTRWGKGSIVGLHLDGWRGTLSFFLNRKPLGLAFSGLQNKEVYPIVSSTSAHSGMKLVTSCTFPANLQFMASEAVFVHLRQESKVHPADLPLPPGLRLFVENNFWPFLRSLGQCKKGDSQEVEMGWSAGGTKHPHTADKIDEDHSRVKRLRRRLLLIQSPPSSSSNEAMSLSPIFSDFIDYSSTSGIPSSLSQVSVSSSSSSEDSIVAPPLVINSTGASSIDSSPVASTTIVSSLASNVAANVSSAYTSRNSFMTPASCDNF